MLCLICNTPDDDRPRNGTAELDALFGHIVRSTPCGFICFSGCHWNSSIYKLLGYDAHLPDLFSDHPLGLACPVSEFTDLLPYAEGNWSDFWLFPSEPPEDLQEKVLLVDRSPTVVYPDGASHLFSNVDAAYWALYTENLKDIKSVEAVWHRTGRHEVQIL